MFIFSIIQIVLSSSLLLYTIFSLDDDYGNDIYNSFHNYVKQFNKSYNPEELLNREHAFKESLRRIEELNKKQNAAVYGINQFSDLTPEEFKTYVLHQVPRSSGKSKRLGEKSPEKNEVYKQDPLLPQRVDWREKNIVSPVRNQYECGSCWAFSTVETIESMYALKTGIMEEWSVQQILDCAPKPNDGCDGGDTCVAIDWLYRKQINLVLAKDYPYADKSGLCKVKRSEKTVKVASNFTCDSFIGEEYLMLYQIAYHGPIVVAVDATKWQDYVAGIIHVDCGNDRNHAVQIVGYDLSNDVPHYIVRNTWGTKFGDMGYLKIAFGNNTCSIAEEVSALDVI